MLAVFITILVASQAVQHFRAGQARQFAADLQKFPVSHGYGIETRTTAATQEATWKAYCYRERESLIAEAEAASK